MPPISFDTLAIHADPRDNERSIAPPIYQTSTFFAPDADAFLESSTGAQAAEFYTRYGNPTRARAESLLAALEGGEAAMLAASGMGAISTMMLALLSSGDHLVMQEAHYGGATALARDHLSRWGVEVTRVPQHDTDAFARAIKPNTRLIYVESPSNPRLTLTDLAAVASLARQHGILTAIDNTFATPWNQRPIELGIDLVIHSATKFLGGHADVTLGAVVGSRALVERVWRMSIEIGAVPSPFEAWLLVRGLRTLSLRMERHNNNALAIARFLETHPAVDAVYYPGLDSFPQRALAERQMRGFGGVLSFDLKGGEAAAEHVLSSVKLFKRAASVGGVESLVVRPAAMLSASISEEEFRAVGVSKGMIRMSVGLEDGADLIADLQQALVH
jgi:methionine-gamma-lyase